MWRPLWCRRAPPVRLGASRLRGVVWALPSLFAAVQRGAPAALSGCLGWRCRRRRWALLFFGALPGSVRRACARGGGCVAQWPPRAYQCCGARCRHFWRQVLCDMLRFHLNSCLHFFEEKTPRAVPCDRSKVSASTSSRSSTTSSETCFENPKNYQVWQVPGCTGERAGRARSAVHSAATHVCRRGAM